MVNHIKFSEFSDAPLVDSDLSAVGLENGANVKFNVQNRWTNATRALLTPFDGLLGYNTDTHVMEYWNGLTMTWKVITAV